MGGNTKNLRPPWKPGESGNPNGRPKKIQAVADKAQDNAEKALDALIKLIGSDDDRVKLQAAMAVLDRAVGKPKQTVESTLKKEPADYSRDELIEIARMGRARASAPGDGDGEPDRIQ